MFDFGKEQQEPKFQMEKEIAYMIKILDLKKMSIFSLIAKNKKQLEQIVSLVDGKIQVVYELQAIGLYKELEDYIKELKKKNKPDDLNFGKT